MNNPGRGEPIRSNEPLAQGVIFKILPPKPKIASAGLAEKIKDTQIIPKNRQIKDFLIIFL